MATDKTQPPSPGGVTAEEKVRLTDAAAAVIKTSRDLVAKLDECRRHIDGAFQMAYSVRGGKYNGPNYAKELEDLRKALSSL